MMKACTICLLGSLLLVSTVDAEPYYFYKLYSSEDPGLDYISSAPPALNNVGQVGFIGGGKLDAMVGTGGTYQTYSSDPTYPAATPDYWNFPCLNDQGVMSWEGSWGGRMMVVSDGANPYAIFDGRAASTDPYTGLGGNRINNSAHAVTWAYNGDLSRVEIAMHDGSDYTVVATDSTPTPGGGGTTMIQLDTTPDINDADEVVFTARSSSTFVDGIYRWKNGVLSRVIDTTSGVAILKPAHINNAGTVIFRGADDIGGGGIAYGVYVATGNNEATRFVSTPFGGGIDEWSVSLNDNGFAAFKGYPTSSVSAISIANVAGSEDVRSVIRDDELLDGREIKQLWFGPEGLNDYGQLAFSVMFEDNMETRIYLASPFPCARPTGLSRGSGTVAYDPQGFVNGGFGIAGLPANGGALSATAQIDDLVLDGGLATVIAAYDPTEVAELGLLEETLRLYWYDETAGGVWQLAGAGQFVEAAPTDVLGNYGIDLEANYVWANVDHASAFGVGGIPEPATLALLLALAAPVALRRRRSGA